MNNEKYNQIMEEAYKNYRSKSKDLDLPENLYNKLIDDLNKDAMFPIDNPNRMLLKDEFINKIKTDTDFSEKWGLRIEERELSLEERNYSLGNDRAYKGLFGFNERDDLEYKEKFDSEKRPTKLITITYNNIKTEIYE